jgi:hypothetical protein
MSRLFQRLAICLLAILAAASLDLGAAMAASSNSVTVGDYVIRAVRAAGLQANLQAEAEPGAYLDVLVQQGGLTGDLASSLPLTALITPHLALMLTKAIGPAVPAPSFLSQAYSNAVLLGAGAEALGFVDSDGQVLNAFGILVIQQDRGKCPSLPPPAQDKGKPKKCR